MTKREKISRIVFYILSLLFAYCTYLLIVDKKYIEAGCIGLIAIISNPFIMDKISKKIGAAKSDYFYALKMMLVFCGIIFAFIIAIVLYFATDMNSFDSDFSDFRAILKISVYVVYLFVLFICKGSDKFFKYMIFGFYYTVCIILSFCSDTFHNYIMDVLRHIPSSNLDVSSYDMLINDCLIPIKEAILTYIIFDTVIKEKEDCISEKGNNIDNLDEKDSAKENNTVNNHIQNIFCVNVQDVLNENSKEYIIEVNKK